MKAIKFGNHLAAAMLASSALIAGSATAVNAAEVVIASYGGSFQDAQSAAFFEPYAEASGVTVTGTTGTGYAKVKARVESGNVIWDVISADGAAYESEVKEGLLEPIDYSVVEAEGIPEDLR